MGVSVKNTQCVSVKIAVNDGKIPAFAVNLLFTEAPLEHFQLSKFVCMYLLNTCVLQWNIIHNVYNTLSIYRFNWVCLTVCAFWCMYTTKTELAHDTGHTVSSSRSFIHWMCAQTQVSQANATQYTAIGRTYARTQISQLIHKFTPFYLYCGTVEFARLTSKQVTSKHFATISHSAIFFLAQVYSSSKRGILC